jgi:nucleotide-binding universal stress UspA family protein
MTAAGELIVCATDLSEGRPVCCNGRRRSRGGKGRASISCTSCPSRHTTSSSSRPTRPRFEAARLHAAQERLQQLIASAESASGTPIRAEILVGSAEGQIVDHARRHAARAIIVGTSSRPAVERWVLGSVAERVVRGAPCPVVVVPHSAPSRGLFAEGGANRR